MSRRPTSLPTPQPSPARKQATAHFRGWWGLPLLLLFTACGSTTDEADPATAAQPLTAVRTQPIRQQPLRVFAAYLGEVQPKHRVIVTARSPGVLSELPFEEGQRVQLGERIARIDAPENALRIQRVRSELKRAETERDFVCQRGAEDRSLTEKGALAPLQAQTTQKNCEVARAAVRAAQAQLKETQLIASRDQEHTPIAGVVGPWLAQPGESVGPGRPLLSISSHTLELRVALNEHDLQRGLGLGSRAELSLPGQAPHLSQIEWVAPQAQGPSRSRAVTLALPDELLPQLYPGLTLDVRFILAEAPMGPTVVADAITQRADQPGVFLVADDRLKWVEVRAGLRAGDWIAVSAPSLPPEGAVVVGALYTLQDGQPVLAIPEERPTK